MANSFFPPQVGFIPTGLNSTRYNSSVVLGRNGNVQWEAVGFGADGRPDNLEYFNIYLTNVSGVNPAVRGAISMNVGDIQTIIDGNSNATAAALTFKLREVDVCDSSVAKKMIFLATEPYLP